MTAVSGPRPAPDADLPRAYRAAPCARFGPRTLGAAWWALRAWRAARARLPVDGLRTIVPSPPRLPAGATRGVLGVLRRTPATCLERCLVLQAWLLACGEPYDVIVGVEADEVVKAHAWMPFETGAGTYRFKEITRIPARTRSPAGIASRTP